MKLFDVKTPYATYPNCYLVVNEYANNSHIAISIYSDGEGPIADLTVNIHGVENKYPYFSCVDTNNCPWAVKLINELGIGKYTGTELVSGWCAYPLIEFDMEKIRQYTREEM